LIENQRKSKIGMIETRLDLRLQDTAQARNADKQFAVGLARAFGGAIIFSLPILMTMEMWYLGFSVDPLRLALLILVFFPLLVALSRYSGFEDTSSWLDDLLDAFVAYAVGFIASVIILLLLGVLDFGASLAEIIGKVSLQAVPGSIGALLAHSQFGGNKEEQQEGEGETYWGEMFLMMVGALFLSFNVAPTEEIVLISYQMTEWHAIALIILSLIIMHAFVYAVEFKGQGSIPPEVSFWSVFLRFTIVGYALVLLISFYMLWTFGQTEGMAVEQILRAVLVLGFPAAVGAAAARLIL
jgi:putative integral membrane protein (TIGR02587 family)